MRTKHAVMIWVLGFSLTSLGGLFKIQHWPFASALLVLGLPLEVIGFFALVMKALRYKGFKDFLDS